MGYLIAGIIVGLLFVVLLNKKPVLTFAKAERLVKKTAHRVSNPKDACYIIALTVEVLGGKNKVKEQAAQEAMKKRAEAKQKQTEAVQKQAESNEAVETMEKQIESLKEQIASTKESTEDELVRLQAAKEKAENRVTEIEVVAGLF